MTKRAKIILIAGLILVLSGAGLYAGLWHLMEKNTQKAARLFDDFISDTRQVERLNSATKEAAVVAEAATMIDSIGVSGFEGQARFLTFLEGLGRETGITVELKNPREEKNNSQSEKDYFLVTGLAQGSWQELFYFITLLENAPMDLSIGRVSFKKLSASAPKTKGAVVARWQADVEVRVLEFKKFKI